MILPKFQFKEPGTLEEACEIAEQYKGDSAFLAGGTDLLVNLKKKAVNYKVLVSLENIAELRQMEHYNGNSLVVGAMVGISELEESSLIKEEFPLLARAAGNLGSPQIRNRATVGGNICTARPAGDTIGPLIAYGATVRLVSKHSERYHSLEDFFLGPGKTVIKEGEILADIQLDAVPANTGTSYIKYGARKAMEIAMVSVTTMLTFENEICKSVRIVLGAVAPTFIRSYEAEKMLSDKPFSYDYVEKAAGLAAGCCRPISDSRASAEYRQELVKVLTRRSLQEAASQCIKLD